jgi:hypothetical protein
MDAGFFAGIPANSCKTMESFPIDEQLIILAKTHKTL